MHVSDLPRRVVFLLFGCLWAAVGDGAATASPEVEQLVQAAARQVQAQTVFGGRVVATQSFQVGPVIQHSSDEFCLVADRREGFALTAQRGQTGLRFVQNDRRVVLYLPGMNEYLQAAPEGNWQTYFEEDNAFGDVAGQFVPWLGLALAGVAPDLANATYVGLEEIEGLSCHHLKLDLGDFDRRVYLAAGEQPQLRRVVDDLDRLLARINPSRPSDEQIGARRQWDFLDWQDKLDVAPTALAIDLPETAQAVAYLGQGDNHGDHALLGEPAPTFTLPLLDGGQVDLASHRGKDIVLIDFWAIRCPPCRAALPVLAEIAEQYRGKGLAVYAINVEDTAEGIGSFLKRMNVQLPVAMGGGSAVSRDYQVSGIPQSVVIGKAGRVQSVHVGFAPQTATQLRAELRYLLAGGSLLDQPPAPPAFDLQLAEVAFAPAKPGVGEPVTFTCVVRNRGDHAAPVYTYRVGLLIDGQEGFSLPGETVINAQGESRVEVPATTWRLAATRPAQVHWTAFVMPAAESWDADLQDNIREGDLEIAADTRAASTAPGQGNRQP